jgi:hypothetical protein
MKKKEAVLRVMFMTVLLLYSALLKPNFNPSWVKEKMTD